jgi:hypothetical protein
LFYAGRMNKDLDERFIKDGEYIDALNIRIGSTELGASSNSNLGSIGAIENSKGNTSLTDIQYVSSDAKCIGAYEDSANETIYWFVTSTDADLVLSYNVTNGTTTNHLVSLSLNPILKFDKDYLINGINKIDDLLFWTDNLNPPRRINVKKPYVNFDESDISVIVAPPMSAPEVSLYDSGGDENYVLEKFLSFSYRYKYNDGEYSALSQFSDIAFEPRQFELDYNNFENLGMTNSFNSIIIKFNTGPRQVVGIDICFKASDSNIINVIEKFDKKKEGWLNNYPNQSLVFTNRKIYTVLLESELLRLYDNVPRIAKAQTSIGNRIMYGNYVDGYDVGEINYSLDVISENSSQNTVNVTYSTGIPYTIDTTKNIPLSMLNIDLTGKSLKKDYALIINFEIIHDSYSGDPAFNTTESPGPGDANNFSYSFSFILSKDYNSVFEMATSQEFKDAVSTHKPYADATKGNSLTDVYNRDKVGKPADTTYPQWDDIDSGITSIGGAFLINAIPGSNIIGLQCPAVKFETEFPTGTFLYAYQYFKNSITQAYFTKLGAKKSLHSNRDYEVAIVYMDNYLRSSTALVDTNNTVYIGPDNSDSINNIRATMISKAPDWATKYKFVLKQSVSSYETVYSGLFYPDTAEEVWFKLEGENRQKVSENQTLIVKSDTNGIVNNLIETTVLDLVSQPNNFISGNKNEGGSEIIEPAGLYMKLRPSGFSAEYDPNSFRWPGSITKSRYVQYYFDELNPEYKSTLPISPTNRQYKPFAIPAGSQISFHVHADRSRRGNSCDSYYYTYTKNFISGNDYNNMFDWFNAEGPNLNEMQQGGGEGSLGNPVVRTTFLGWSTSSGPVVGDKVLKALSGNFVNNFLFQAENASTGDIEINKYGLTYEQGRLRFVATTGMPGCSSPDKRVSRVTVDIKVQTASGVLIFETQPEPSNGEIYYENSQSFDIIDGYHSGNIQNQTATQDAIIDLEFFNCFSFGNGVESYKIKDTLTGAPFYLGSRVTSVSREDFMEANRYAGITYSGIYNAETNLNKLNEFNLALVNWKDCEKSFGPINVLHGRKTDVLVLQEDKISNVLVGKNLLSDAAGGGAITATPEVLGTQIARIEEYGISSNPESFVVYGYDSYFTDTKRNVVLNLKGEDLIPISNTGMSSWFRNKFKDRIGYQNIGGYDPYMKEYVLSINDNKLPSEPIVYNCGTTISQKNTSTPSKFYVEVGSIIGDVDIDYNFSSGSSKIIVRYNGAVVVDRTITGTGFYSFNKTLVDPTIIEVEMDPVDATYSILFNCAESEEITVVRIVLNSVDDLGKTIHNNYNWTLGSHISVSKTDFILMENDTVSLYNTETEMASFGVIPAFGSTVKMSSNKLTDDTFVFDDNDFKYLVSDRLYSEGEINLLKGELDLAVPVSNPSTGNYEASFLYDNPNRYKYLYLVWDYSISTEIDLCYDYNSYIQACFCAPNVITVSITNVTETTATFNGNFTNNGGDTLAVRGFVYSTGPNPTTANSVITDVTGVEGTYSLNATTLNSGTTYYVRAYAIVFGDTIYGDDIPFTTTSVITCDVEIISTVTTDPDNIPGDNGTATIIFEGGVGPFTYELNSIAQGAAVSPLVINGLQASTSYTVEIIDSNDCSDSVTFTLGESTFYFDADYIMLTYEFTDGLDLDTRTRIAIPDIGQDTQQEYIGWDLKSVWPITGTPILTWGGDNQGVGFESVLIDVNQFKINYPSATNFVVDARCFWFNTVGINPVNVAATLWKGGTPIKDGCYQGQYYCWTNPTATNSGSIDSVGIVITSDGLPTKSLSSGQRAATLTYDLVTKIGVLNNNDTTTPSV